MTIRVAALAYAWSAALAFAVSLAYFFYFYLVVLDQAPHRVSGVSVASGSRGFAMATVINVVLFTIFATHHSVMARTGMKRRLARWLPPELERSTYVWISSVLFFVTCWWWQPMPDRIYAASGLAAWLLRAVQLAGLVLIARTTGLLDFLELAGVRQVTTAFDSRADPARPAEAGHYRNRDPATRTRPATADPPAERLIVTGPYRLVRHPLYLGWMLFVFGVPEMSMGRFLFAATSSAYLLLAIQWEEQSLVGTYGQDYLRYRTRVRWRVIPFIY